MKLKAMFSKKNSSKSEKDPILYSYEDSVLRASDIETLAEGHWLNDAVIGFFYTYLEHNNPSNQILLLQPSMVHLYRQSHDPASLAGVLPNSLYTANYIFIPINDHFNSSAGGNHWSLLVFSRPDASFFYYDSLNNSNYNHARHAATNLLKLMRLPSTSIRVLPTPQQSNGNDCGVFVISFSEALFISLSTMSSPIQPPPPYIWTIQSHTIYPPSTQRQRILTLANRFKK